MNKRKLLFSGIGIFLAGVLAGGAGTALFSKARLAPMVRMEKLGPAGFFLERLSYALNLTDEQKVVLRPILEDVMKQVHEAREPCMQAEEETLRAGDERIKAVLTPEQTVKFTNLMVKVRERRKKFFDRP
jgi:hypothetical protein